MKNTRATPRVSRLQNRWQRLEQVLDGCVSLTSYEAEPARHYLDKQGINLNSLKNIRQLQCHPQLAYPLGKGKERFPVLISCVHVEPCLWVNLHCTYLTKAGKLAEVAAPQRLVNPIPPSSRLGGAVRLFPVVNGKLLLVEDIATALLVHQKTGLPCWACLSSKNIAEFILPNNVHSLYVIGSETAGWKLASRLQASECRVYVQPLSVLEKKPAHVLS